MKNNGIALARFPGDPLHRVHVFGLSEVLGPKFVSQLNVEVEGPQFVVSSWNDSDSLWIWDRYEGELGLDQIVNLKPSLYFRDFSMLGTSQIEFEAQISRALEAIEAGILNKVVLARERCASGSWNWEGLTKIFAELCLKHPQAFVYLCTSSEWGTWMGASPEVLLKHHNETVEVMSLAGTLFNEEEQWTEKERAEQRVTSDFIEECLNWAEEERVEIIELHQGKLRHLLSTYRKSWPKTALSSLVQQLSPTPAVCGFPRFEAADFIAKNERIKRDLYAGYIGIQNPEGVLLNVNLRCAEFGENGVRLIAGGGINAKSNWEREWLETELKMGVISANLF